MEPHGLQRTLSKADSPAPLRRTLGFMSLATMLLTIPQVWTIWMRHEAAGVSAVSWGAYLVSALLWLWHGVAQRDPNIYLPCIGWILLDAAVLVGALVYR
jgi:uncharacterized protein with PQ loop repeat